MPDFGYRFRVRILGTMPSRSVGMALPYLPTMGTAPSSAGGVPGRLGGLSRPP